jgi:membrane associated rhomboid family serine protease
VFVPYSVDALLERRPVVNWIVLGVVALAFLLQMTTSEGQVSKETATKKPLFEDELGRLQLGKKRVDIAARTAERQAVTGPLRRFVLRDWGIEGLFGYMWLHPNVIRLIGNLVFLWAFGNAVCSKIGNKAYLVIYILLGLLTGIIHLAFTDSPMVGASGVVNGVVGMYIVIFPENLMNCYFFLPRPMAASISGLWIVLLWFIFDIFEVVIGGQSGVYYAHIGGLLAGGGLAFLMLKKKWVVMERDERSLLHVLGLEKQEELVKDEEGEKKEVKKEGEEGPKRFELVESAKPATEKAKPPAIPDDGYIHFSCLCGRKMRVRKEHAGKSARCPKCSAKLKIPIE